MLHCMNGQIFKLIVMGKHSMFWMKIASMEKGKLLVVQIQISLMDGLPYLKIILIDSSCHNYSIRSGTCESYLHAYNLSILDLTNENLICTESSASWSFLFGPYWDWAPLITLQTNFRHELECSSCLVPKHLNVTMSCTSSLCLACDVAKACKSSMKTATAMVIVDQQHVFLLDTLWPGEQACLWNYKPMFGAGCQHCVDLSHWQ